MNEHEQNNLGFTVKDSGQRQQFDSGMQRDTTEGKILWHLAFDGPMFKRYAVHLTKGAVKYEARNWMKANGHAEMERFKESAVRHFIQWMNGEVDEDHASAVLFNINGFEYVLDQLRAKAKYDRDFPPATRISGREILAMAREAEGRSADTDFGATADGIDGVRSV